MQRLWETKRRKQRRPRESGVRLNNYRPSHVLGQFFSRSRAQALYTGECVSGYAACNSSPRGGSHRFLKRPRWGRHTLFRPALALVLFLSILLSARCWKDFLSMPHFAIGKAPFSFRTRDALRMCVDWGRPRETCIDGGDVVCRVPADGKGRRTMEWALFAQSASPTSQQKAALDLHFIYQREIGFAFTFYFFY